MTWTYRYRFCLRGDQSERIYRLRYVQRLAYNTPVSRLKNDSSPTTFEMNKMLT